MVEDLVVQPSLSSWRHGRGGSSFIQGLTTFFCTSHLRAILSCRCSSPPALISLFFTLTGLMVSGLSIDAKCFLLLGAVKVIVRLFDQVFEGLRHVQELGRFLKVLFRCETPGTHRRAYMVHSGSIVLVALKTKAALIDLTEAKIDYGWMSFLLNLNRLYFVHAHAL